MVRKLSLLLIISSSFALLSMDKKTWYIERDNWKPGISSKVPAQFESFDKVADALKKIAPGSKEAHLRLLIMKIINQKVKYCFEEILRAHKLQLADILNNFVINQDIKEEEIQPGVRKNRAEIQKFIDELISPHKSAPCDLFKEKYFNILQIQLREALKSLVKAIFMSSTSPKMYINEDTIKDLNIFLYEAEQIAYDLFVDEPIAEKIEKLNTRKKALDEDGKKPVEYRLISSLDQDKQNSLKEFLSRAIVYAVRDLAVLQEKEHKEREKKEKEEASAAEQKNVSATSSNGSRVHELAGSLELLAHAAKTPPAVPPLKKAASKTVPPLPPLPSMQKSKKLPELSAQVSGAANGKKAAPPLPELPKKAVSKEEPKDLTQKQESTKTTETISESPEATQVELSKTTAGSRRAKPSATRKKPRVKKFKDVVQQAVERAKKEKEYPKIEQQKAKELATALPDFGRQLKAFQMKVSIEPEAFAEVLADLERWHDKHELSVELEKKYTALQNNIKSLYNDRFKDKQAQLDNLVIQMRAEKEADEAAAAERRSKKSK